MVCGLSQGGGQLSRPQGWRQAHSCSMASMRISCPSGPEVLDSSQPQKSFSGVSWRGGPRLPLAPQSPPSGDVQRLLGASGGKGSGSLRGPEGDLVGTWRLEPWGQLLQTHSFLLSRDPPPPHFPHHLPPWTMVPSAPRDEWSF